MDMDMDAPRLALDEWTGSTFTLVAEHKSLQQIIDAADGLIQLAYRPTRPKTAPLLRTDLLDVLIPVDS